MDIASIRGFPTLIEKIPAGSAGVHESVFRVFQILEKTKDFLRRGVPNDVVLELIEEMESTKGFGES